MTWTTSDIPDLTGKVAVVTGSNAGLGFHIASDLAGAGARVIMACRNETKATEAANKIRMKSPLGTVETMTLDLADLSSVKTFSERLHSTVDRLDILGNNAGLMAVDKSTTVDGFETQFGVNHLGHFALTGLVLPMLLATPGSRVVNHSSMGHRPGKMHLDDLNYERRRYSRWPAYFQSKLANLLFSLDLQRRLSLAGASTIALTAHPGGSRTDLGVEGSGLLNKLLKPIGGFGQSAAKGALPFVRACVDPSAKGGDFFGPRYLMFGSPKLETPTKRARDASVAKQLWARSEDLTGIRYLD
jgi:NAD(P)-dependent dehydrogenase (short-subunit alcohol dehydrogenase family)